MKTLKLTVLTGIALLMATAYTTNKNLTQEGAEKAIREFIKISNSSAIGPTFTILEVIKIDPVDQSSDTKAMCGITAKAQVRNAGLDSVPIACTYIESPLLLSFGFEKKADNKWVLTGMYKCATKVRVSNEYSQRFHKQSTGLNISAE